MTSIPSDFTRTLSEISSLSADDVQIAETKSDVVWQRDKVTINRYCPTRDIDPSFPPIVISYGLFGRQTMIDLQDDRSLVQTLIKQGIDTYFVDWGTPSRVDQFLSIDDYVLDYLKGGVDHVARATALKPTLFGICEGGTFAACLAALEPDLLGKLALAITPIDFDPQPENYWLGEGFLNIWTQNLDESDIDDVIDLYGMLPGSYSGAVFSALTPMATMTKYNIGLARLNGDRDATMNFLRMEKWIADRPDHPGTAARQWLKNLYHRNQLVKGDFVLDGRAVDLRQIACPVLNIFALRDHIIPVSSSKALGRFVPEDRYQEIGFPGGHVGVFVSSKAQGVVAEGLAAWLQNS